MNRLGSILAAGVLACVQAVGSPIETEVDPVNDARARRTDPGADGPMNPGQVLPDLKSISIAKWVSFQAPNNAFVGFASELGHLLRVEMVFKGLINPPGPLFDGFDPNSPFRYGPSPLFAFVEFNVDRHESNGGRDTGGDPTAEAGTRFLANVGRFGGLPGSSASGFAITRPGQLDADFTTPPYFERSGAEFVLKLCGCEDFKIISSSMPHDTTFDAGDTWVIRGKFFERTNGFRGISRMICPAQRYTPDVDLQFSHSVSMDQTTVTMIYAIDQEGARQLAGLGTIPEKNTQVGCDGNQGSVQEALCDVVMGVKAASLRGWSGVDLPSRILSEKWLNREELLEDIDPTDWRISVLVGTTYSRTILDPSSEGADYIWTDTLDVACGDQNGDGQVNVFDRDAISARLAMADGTGADADQMDDGVYTIPNFGADFDICDVNYDGVVDCHDLNLFGISCCPPDWNQSGTLTLQDLFDFLAAWFNGSADYNRDMVTSLQDLFDYLAAFFAGC